jgi:hypothetical protein
MDLHVDTKVWEYCNLTQITTGAVTGSSKVVSLRQFAASSLKMKRINKIHTDSATFLYWKVMVLRHETAGILFKDLKKCVI